MEQETDSKGHPVAQLTRPRKRSRPPEALNATPAAIEGRNGPQRLEYLLAVNPAIIYTTEAAGDYRCTYVSENLRAIMGYTPREMTTDLKFWPALLHPDDAARVLEEMRPLIGRGGGVLQYRFQHRDGHYIWIQDAFKVIYDSAGQPCELVGAWADITERKRAEQEALDANAELQKTKRYLTRLIESSPDAIIATDREGRIVLFSEGAETLFGYRGDEVLGSNATLLYGGDAGMNEIGREMRKRGGTVSGLDTVLWAKDGTSIPVLISASVLYDEDGQEVGTVGFNTDMRGRKRDEEALQRAHDELERRVGERTAQLNEARGRLQYLLTVTPGIIYTSQPSKDFRCTFISENVELIMGFSTWEMLEDPDFWTKRLHPDDAHRVLAEMPALIDKGGGAVEYRFRHRDGHYAWIQDTFKVLHDGSGRAIEIVGSWADISDRKQVEQALGERMSLMNDLEKLVAASPAVIYATKASDDYACTYVSENLLSTMGYAPWEMREDPRFWSMRLHAEDAPQVFAQMNPLIEKGGGCLEYRFRHRRGHYLWIQDTFTVRHAADGKPLELVGSWADISERKHVEDELHRMAEQVEVRNRFIRETFGRYLTDDIVTTLLESPAGLRMGGEKRKVTMLMSDLRGFTSLSERLAPQRVVAVLNRYLASMVKVIREYEGTIDEFIGDAIFVLFGAPTWADDDAQRAVACAVAMQLAMESVNAYVREEELPEVEMGIGVHTGQVVVGNIGSPERMKYGVVGRHVNAVSRIQSFTTGGQILISETTRKEVGGIVRVGKRLEIKAKGIDQPLTLYEALGISGRHKLFLPEMAEPMVRLPEAICFKYAVIDDEQVGDELFAGSLIALSSRMAEVRLDQPVATLDNLALQFGFGSSDPVPGALYGKVIGAAPDSSSVFIVRFATMSPEIEEFLRSARREGRAHGRTVAAPASPDSDAA